MAVWTLRGILSIPKITQNQVYCHGCSSCHERTVLCLSVAGKKSGNKNEGKQNCLFEKREAYEIKKLRSNVRIRAISLSQFFFIHAMAVCLQRQTHFIGFVLWVLCSHQDAFCVVQAKREESIGHGSRVTLMGAVMGLWMVYALLDRHALVPVDTAVGRRCVSVQSCCSKGSFFHSQEMLHSFSLAIFCPEIM